MNRAEEIQKQLEKAKSFTEFANMLDEKKTPYRLTIQDGRARLLGSDGAWNVECPDTAIHIPMMALFAGRLIYPNAEEEHHAAQEAARQRMREKAKKAVPGRTAETIMLSGYLNSMAERRKG